MESPQEPSRFQSAVDDAAASWFAKRHDTISSPSSSRHQSTPSAEQLSSTSRIATPSAASNSQVSLVETAEDSHIGSDITAWQTALQSLAPEAKNQSEPGHPLASALVHQPTLRQIEWNPYRNQGGFVPRTGHDFSSMMIFICGQINPNPCRNCLLRNGPFAQCVVSPPGVLANSTLRHACANCTYQNQYRKCNNDPISEEEMARSMLVKGSGPRALPLKPRRPKVPSAPKTQKTNKDILHQQQQHHNHMVHKPMPQPTSFDTFADKLRHARTLSPRSRRRMNAEALQWQAAIATLEAEGTVSAPDPIPAPGLHLKGSQASRSALVAAPASVTTSQGPTHPTRATPFLSAGQQSAHGMADDQTEMSENGGYLYS